MAASQMQLEDWLDDLCVRFIINLPQEDLSSVARICFQVEEAQWFYEDFIRPLDPTLPSMSLRTFCLRIFQHCPLLASFSVENHTKAFEEFLEYKTRVPVRGAIMLNSEMDSTVLVKGWKKGASWSFPRGKINKDEDDLDCAIREVYEETGLDLRAAGLVPTEAKPKYIEIAMREQHMRLYVFRDIPMDTVFEPKTRKEISKIEWYKLSELPAFRKKNGQNSEPAAAPNANKFYMVAPFLVPLKKWVSAQKRAAGRKGVGGSQVPGAIDETHYEDQAWKTDTGAEDVEQTPGIETLEGATQELHRLLKMQPSTQGIQALQGAPASNAPQGPMTSSQHDKGSALLSILQAKGGNSQPVQHGGQYPHTPSENTVPEVHQPQTPHHHNHNQLPSFNAQQPPPSFPFAPNQAAQWAQPSYPSHGQSYNQSYNQQYASAPQPQHGGHQAPLVHPQPLPPQVQRAVFNRSAFQDGSQPQLSGAPRTYADPQQAQQAQQVQLAQAQAQAQAQRGLPGQLPAHFAKSEHARQVPMSGQSMALLDAFKGGNTSTHFKENARQPNAAAPTALAVPTGPAGAGHGSAYPNLNQLPPYTNFGPPQGPAQIPPQPPVHATPQTFSQHPGQMHPQFAPHMAGLAGGENRSQPSPKELQGSKVGPPTDGHRSALLGMFRKEGEPSPAQELHHTPVQPNTGNILDQLRRSAGPAHMQVSPKGSVDMNISNSLDGLSIQGRPSEVVTPESHQVVSQPVAAQQPTRILQRGQHEAMLAVGGPVTTSPKPSPQALASQLVSANAAASPAMSASVLSHGQSFGGRRPESGADQKRQLLSLFGNTPSPASMEATARSRDAMEPKSRLSSFASGAAAELSQSRHGSQTPISPADQSFLLGYLQSVTNNAKR